MLSLWCFSFSPSSIMFIVYFNRCIAYSWKIDQWMIPLSFFSKNKVRWGDNFFDVFILLLNANSLRFLPAIFYIYLLFDFFVL